jgi:hypothetical protein
MEIDDDEPYTVGRAPDRNGDERNVIVFKLRRVGGGVPVASSDSPSETNGIDAA